MHTISRKFGLVLAMSVFAMPQPVFAQQVDFGDDSSEWANDNECDDSRFTGPGMTTTPLLDEDIGHDATDCRTAYEQGQLTLRNDDFSGYDASHIQFGDDASQWANDGECDDRRFIGEGMTSTPLLDEDIGHDATDCRIEFQKGRLVVRDGGPGMRSSSHIDWGDDDGAWANDGECDDRRFTGPGMTTTTLLDADIRHDATDCRTAYEQGRLEPK